MDSMALKLELEGFSHQQCAIKVAALLEGASSRHAADGLLQALLRSKDRTLNTIGANTAVQLKWLDGLLPLYQRPETRRLAMQASLDLATDAAAIGAIVRGGLDLDTPAAQDTFFRQVEGCNNPALADAVTAELQARRGTLSDRLLPARLTHLKDADSINQAVMEDKRLLFQLPWKRVALRHPLLGLQLMRMALETGDSDVALGKRWSLVQPAVQVVLSRRRCPDIAAILDLAAAFPVPKEPLPPPLLSVAPLLVPPKGSPAAAEVTGRFLDVLLRVEGQDTLRVRAGSPWLGFLSNKRVQRTLATFPGALERLADVLAVSDAPFAAFLAAVKSPVRRSALYLRIADWSLQPPWMADERSLRGMLKMFTPRLRDRLAKELLASREAQEDLALQRRMMTHRYLPEVRAALMAGCRAAVAGDRCKGLKDLLSCAQLSRIDMSEVLDFVAARIRNEQVPVVAGVLAALKDMPACLWRAEHVPLLDRLVKDALAAQDHRCSQLIAGLLLRILDFRLQHSPDPNTDPLLGFTLGMALRDIQALDWQEGLVKAWPQAVSKLPGPGTRYHEPCTRLSPARATAVAPTLLSWLHQLWLIGPAAGVCLTMRVAEMLGTLALAFSELQAIVEKGLFTEVHLHGRGKRTLPADICQTLEQVMLTDPKSRVKRARLLILEPAALEQRYGVELRKTLASALAPHYIAYGCSHLETPAALAALVHTAEDLDGLWQLANGLLMDRPHDQNDLSSPAETLAKTVARLLNQQARHEFKSRLVAFDNFAAGLLQQREEAQRLKRLQVTPPPQTNHHSRHAVTAVQCSMPELVQWIIQECSETSQNGGRSAVPALGAALLSRAYHTRVAELAKALRQLLGLQKLALTMRKQILRVLVRYPSQETNNILDELLEGFASLHRDLKIAAFSEMLACQHRRDSSSFWNLSAVCAASSDEYVACALLNSLAVFLKPECVPEQCQRYFNLLLTLKDHPMPKIPALLWKTCNSAQEPACLVAASQAAQGVVSDVTQGLVGSGWRSAATVLVTSCNTKAGMECLLRCIEHGMASGLAGESCKPQMERERDQPLRQRLLHLCTLVALKAGELKPLEHFCEAAADIGALLLRCCPQFLHQHGLLATLGVTQLPWAHTDSSRVTLFYDRLAEVLRLCNDREEVQAVAWEVKKQVAQYIFVDTGSIKSLITLLAASEQAPERRVAVDMLHAHGSQRRWGELWMVELLAELRRDSDTGVAMAAYSQFCFSE